MRLGWRFWLRIPMNPIRSLNSVRDLGQPCATYAPQPGVRPPRRPLAPAAYQADLGRRGRWVAAPRRAAVRRGRGAVVPARAATRATGPRRVPGGGAPEPFGPVPPGRLSARGVFHSKSLLYGAFVWTCRALNRPKWPGQIHNASVPCAELAPTAEVGFSRMVVSEIEAPNLFVDLV